jgi:nitrate/nitrite-specific signal transduction histidine kinase
MHLPDRRAGQVMVSVSQQNGSLHCIVQDNGIGRQRATEIKANRSAGSKKSVGMRITQDRIEMINKLYDLNARVEITDLKNEAGEAAGTRVELVIPV